MRSLKLYVKTTLLASVVTVLVLAVAFGLFSVRVAHLLQEKEKELARVQAASLAQHLVDAQAAPPDLRRAVLLVQRSNPSVVAVHLWKRAPIGEWREFSGVGDGATALAPETQSKLVKNQVTELFEAQLEGAEGARFHAFAPVRDAVGAVVGGVEIVARLDSPLSVAASYARNEAGLMLTAILLITGGSYALSRYFVQHPLAHLLAAMENARQGRLAARAPVLAQDEMGQAAERFNAMMERLEELTQERETQQETLRERVREATAELRQRNEELAAANLEVWRTSRRLADVERLTVAGQTAAQFAHEVGTPLNLIGGHVQLLRLSCRQGHTEAAAQRLDIVTEQIERIERIVRQTLDRTRLEKTEPADFDLAEVARRTLQAAAPLLAARKVQLIEELDSPLPPLCGNADQLQQIILNLANNALDAMPDGGTLRVRGEHIGGQIVFDLADDGYGMNEEVRAHIFEPLYTTKERGRGTGLGLVIVRQLVQENGGTIEVESTPGQGTRFRLRFSTAV